MHKLSILSQGIASIGAGGAYLASRVLALFTGRQGLWLDPSDLSASKLTAGASLTNAQFLAAYPATALYQESTGVTATKAIGEVVGLAKDKSGNANNLTQATAAARPTFSKPGTVAYLAFDATDDALVTTVPVGGYTGTLVMGSTTGMVALDCVIPAGTLTLNRNFLGADTTGLIIRSTAMTAAEVSLAYSYLASVGSGPADTYTGPVTIPDGVTLTVIDGKTWSIL